MFQFYEQIKFDDPVLDYFYHNTLKSIWDDNNKDAKYGEGEEISDLLINFIANTDFSEGQMKVLYMMLSTHTPELMPQWTDEKYQRYKEGLGGYNIEDGFDSYIVTARHRNHPIPYTYFKQRNIDEEFQYWTVTVEFITAGGDFTKGNEVSYVFAFSQESDLDSDFYLYCYPIIPSIHKYNINKIYNEFNKNKL